jgi:hypothetical protein
MSVTAPAGGTGTHVVAYGNNLAVTFDADTSYSIAQVIVDGQALTGPFTDPYTYTFTNVTGNHTISASTTTTTWDIDVTLTDGGSVTDVDNSTAIDPPGATVTVDDATDRTFEVTPNTHYQITSVQANGGDVTLDGNNQYTFTNVTADQTFDVVFTEDAKYALNVTLAGTGAASGSVRSVPAGIACDANGGCSSNFYTGESVELTARSTSGATFMGWSGAGCSGTDTCTVTMDQVRDVTATFDKASNIFIFMPAINAATATE